MNPINEGESSSPIDEVMNVDVDVDDVRPVNPINEGESPRLTVDLKNINLKLELADMIEDNSMRVLNIIQVNKSNYCKNSAQEMFLKLILRETSLIEKRGKKYFFNTFFYDFSSKKSIFHLLNDYQTKINSYFRIKRDWKTICTRQRRNDNDDGEILQVELTNIKKRYRQCMKETEKQVQSSIEILTDFGIDKRWINAFYEVAFTKGAIICLNKFFSSNVNPLDFSPQVSLLTLWTTGGDEQQLQTSYKYSRGRKNDSLARIKETAMRFCRF